MTSCSVYAREEAIYISVEAETTDGIRVFGGKIFKIPRNSSPDAIGIHVLKALDSDQKQISTSSSLKEISQSFLEHVNFKSWTAFYSGCQLINVEQSGSEVKMAPTSLDGKGNFLHRPELEVRSHLEAAEVGQAIFKVLNA